MAYGSPQFKDPRVLSAGQFNDVTQIDRVSPDTFEKPWRPGRRRLNHEAGIEPSDGSAPQWR